MGHPLRYVASAFLGMVLVACSGRGTGTPTSTQTVTPDHRMQALLGIPDTRIAYVLVSRGGPWTTWKLPVLSSAATSASLHRVAGLLRAATPLSGVAKAADGGSADGLRQVIPSATTRQDWTVTWSSGPTLDIVADIDRCHGVTCQSSPDDVSINNIPAYAPGLLSALKDLTDPLTEVTALAITPDVPSPGGAVTVVGSGWLGPAVQITLSWGQGMFHQQELGTAPVNAGAFRWTGRVPSNLPPGSCSLSAEDGIRSFGYLGVSIR